MTTVFNSYSSDLFWLKTGLQQRLRATQDHSHPWLPALGSQRDLAALSSAKPFMRPMLKASLHHRKAQNSPTHHSCQWES